MKIKIKPLSANQAFKGRRFKTPLYKAYEEELMWLLPKMEIPQGRLSVFYEFGLSSKNADGDNCIKQFQDILAKKYGFNDKDIFEWIVVKEIVKKGQEYISFNIFKYEK